VAGKRQSRGGRGRSAAAGLGRGRGAAAGRCGGGGGLRRRRGIPVAVGWPDPTAAAFLGDVAL